MQKRNVYLLWDIFREKQNFNWTNIQNGYRIKLYTDSNICFCKWNGGELLFCFFRQLVVDDMNAEEEMIGGLGIVVEIDGSKFSKFKHHRGKHCGDGSWVFGGIKRKD